MGDMSVRGSPNEYVPNEEMGQSKRVPSRSIKESVLSSIRKEPSVSVSSPRRMSPISNVSFSKKLYLHLFNKFWTEELVVLLQSRWGRLVAKWKK